MCAHVCDTYAFRLINTIIFVLLFYGIVVVVVATLETQTRGHASTSGMCR